jgi:predicted TPR repeat methyltransferase
LSFASGAQCPPQYQREMPNGGTYCTKNAVMDLAANGVPQWMRIWMNTGTADNAVAYEYSAAARAYLPAEQIDPTFDNDLAVWLATRPQDPCRGPFSDQCGNQ